MTEPGSALSPVLLAHGSPDPRHSCDVDSLAARVGRLLRRTVSTAYLDHHGPTLPDLAEQAAAEGRTLQVVPLFLSPGLHATADVPELVDQSRSHTAVALAPAPLVVEQASAAASPVPPPWLGAAVAELASQTVGKGRPSAVILVGAGSRRPAVLQAWDRLAAACSEAWGLQVSAAHGTGPGRRIADAAQPPGAMSVAVMVADGLILDMIREQSASAGVVFAGYVGSTAAFAELMVELLEGADAAPL